MNNPQSPVTIICLLVTFIKFPSLVFYITFFSRVMSKYGRGISYGGQIGYGNESWGKVFFDVLIIGFSESINMLGLYERKSGDFFWQIGIGLVSDTYYHEDYFEDDDYEFISGVGIRIGLGYNYALGDYFLIRPALESNLGLGERLNNFAININFGFKTLNLW